VIYVTEIVPIWSIVCDDRRHAPNEVAPKGRAG